jgi:hypothetical protein
LRLPIRSIRKQTSTTNYPLVNNHTMASNITTSEASSNQDKVANDAKHYDTK